MSYLHLHVLSFLKFEFFPTAFFYSFFQFISLVETHIARARNAINFLDQASKRDLSKAKMCHSNTNVKFENFMHSVWRERERRSS